MYLIRVGQVVIFQLTIEEKVFHNVGAFCPDRETVQLFFEHWELE